MQSQRTPSGRWWKLLACLLAVPLAAALVFVALWGSGLIQVRLIPASL
jgi:hypothetical protein